MHVDGMEAHLGRGELGQEGRAGLAVRLRLAGAHARL